MRLDIASLVVPYRARSRLQSQYYAQGRALGVTMFLPEKDQYSASKQNGKAKFQVWYGGRLAEQIIYGTEKVTTGASNDIEEQRIGAKYGD